MKPIVLISFICLFMISCKKQNPLEKIISSDAPQIVNVVKNIEKHEVQILYSQIDRNKKGQVIFTDYEFNVSDSTYFYPASSVKLPIALLALEKLNELQKKSIPIYKETNFSTEQDSTYTTIEKEITKIFAVSDNQGYNRLFEFLGQNYINQTLNSKNIDSRISHRLSIDNADNIKSQSLVFKKNIRDSIHLYKQASIKNQPITKLSLEKTLKGKGYIHNDSLIQHPKDFSKKNYLPLRSLHEIMKRIQFPEVYSSKECFNILKKDHDFVLEAMKTLPFEVGYDKKEYYDGYVKFFMFGDTKEDIPKHIEIYNKVGYAYGYLTDCAYIKDTKNNVEFILSATIHVNVNEIFNDNNYEYDAIGIPFLAELGRKIYDLEKRRSN
ncbi:Beta-lactamase enzyme family protein [Aquimarina amphilecti]|uniref:Beta-lactamase enzyme family protein n=1 Tax=Aquimarina amphilecti TaxID=1038014 RepID=A0A1H7Q433_AQUAM|nr:serine hydrolase [Aquimarina amphilecti]SEL42434.1 Beta-lactamase enzyme family protein [Aquimarina amphilecti]